MFIGNGYRVYHDGDFDNRDEKRGSSPVDMSQKTTPYPYNFKLIKSGNLLYMLAKTDSQEEYTLIHTVDLIGWLGTPDIGYAIGWFSFGYNDMEVYDIKLEAINEDNASEIYSHITLENTPGGTVTVDGGFDVLVGSSFTVKATPEAGKRVTSITVNGKSVDYTVKNGVVEAVCTADANEMAVAVTFGDEVYDVQVKVQRANENAKYIKAVCGDEVKIFKVVRSAAEASEETAYNDGTNFNMQLPYGNGTWTITFWNDEACESQQIGGSVTVEINKN